MHKYASTASTRLLVHLVEHLSSCPDILLNLRRGQYFDVVKVAACILNRWFILIDDPFAIHNKLILKARTVLIYCDF